MFTWADVRGELAALSDAPLAAAVIVVVAVFAVYRIMNRLAEHRLAQKDDQIAAQNQRIEGLKDRLNFSVGTQDVRNLPAAPAPNPLAPPDELLTPVIRNVAFRLVDALAREPGAELRGRVFEDCRICGPAVVLFGRDMTLERNELIGPFDALAWEVEPLRGDM
jgi:hypothetical protein